MLEKIFNVRENRQGIFNIFMKHGVKDSAVMVQTEYFKLSFMKMLTFGIDRQVSQTQREEMERELSELLKISVSISFVDIVEQGNINYLFHYLNKYEKDYVFYQKITEYCNEIDLYSDKNYYEIDQLITCFYNDRAEMEVLFKDLFEKEVDEAIKLSEQWNPHYVIEKELTDGRLEKILQLEDKKERRLFYINTFSDSGDTCLHVAIKTKQMEVFNRLVSSGADLWVKNRAGVLVYDLIKDTDFFNEIYKNFMDEIRFNIADSLNKLLDNNEQTLLFLKSNFPMDENEYISKDKLKETHIASLSHIAYAVFAFDEDADDIYELTSPRVMLDDLVLSEKERTIIDFSRDYHPFLLILKNDQKNLEIFLETGKKDNLYNNINNMRSVSGDTLLHYAVKCGKEDISAILLRFDADLMIRNNRGALAFTPKSTDLEANQSLPYQTGIQYPEHILEFPDAMVDILRFEEEIAKKVKENQFMEIYFLSKYAGHKYSHEENVRHFPPTSVVLFLVVDNYKPKERIKKMLSNFKKFMFDLVREAKINCAPHIAYVSEIEKEKKFKPYSGQVFSLQEVSGFYEEAKNKAEEIEAFIHNNGIHETLWEEVETSISPKLTSFTGEDLYKFVEYLEECESYDGLKHDLRETFSKIPYLLEIILKDCVEESKKYPKGMHILDSFEKYEANFDLLKEYDSNRVATWAPTLSQRVNPSLNNIKNFFEQLFSLMDNFLSDDENQKVFDAERDNYKNFFELVENLSGDRTKWIGTIFIDQFDISKEDKTLFQEKMSKYPIIEDVYHYYLLSIFKKKSAFHGARTDSSFDILTMKNNIHALGKKFEEFLDSVNIPTEYAVFHLLPSMPEELKDPIKRLYFNNEYREALKLEALKKQIMWKVRDFINFRASSPSELDRLMKSFKFPSAFSDAEIEFFIALARDAEHIMENHKTIYNYLEPTCQSIMNNMLKNWLPYNVLFASMMNSLDYIGHWGTSDSHIIESYNVIINYLEQIKFDFFHEIQFTEIKLPLKNSLLAECVHKGKYQSCVLLLNLGVSPIAYLVGKQRIQEMKRVAEESHLRKLSQTPENQIGLLREEHQSLLLDQQSLRKWTEVKVDLLEREIEKNRVNINDLKAVSGIIIEMVEKNTADIKNNKTGLDTIEVLRSYLINMEEELNGEIAVLVEKIEASDETIKRLIGEEVKRLEIRLEETKQSFRILDFQQETLEMSHRILEEKVNYFHRNHQPEYFVEDDLIVHYEGFQKKKPNKALPFFRSVVEDAPVELREANEDIEPKKNLATLSIGIFYESTEIFPEETITRRRFGFIPLNFDGRNKLGFQGSCKFTHKSAEQLSNAIIEMINRGHRIGSDHRDGGSDLVTLDFIDSDRVRQSYKYGYYKGKKNGKTNRYPTPHSHSEQHLYQALNVYDISNLLSQFHEKYSDFKTGCKIYAVTFDLYSDRTMCDGCKTSAIALQNLQNEEGYMYTNSSIDSFLDSIFNIKKSEAVQRLLEAMDNKSEEDLIKELNSFYSQPMKLLAETLGISLYFWQMSDNNHLIFDGIHNRGGTERKDILMIGEKLFPIEFMGYGDALPNGSESVPPCYSFLAKFKAYVQKEGYKLPKARIEGEDENTLYAVTRAVTHELDGGFNRFGEPKHPYLYEDPKSKNIKLLENMGIFEIIDSRESNIINSTPTVGGSYNFSNKRN